MSSPTMYLRVKRQKTIYFLECTPQDSIGSLKTKLAHGPLNREKDPKDLKFFVATAPRAEAAPAKGTAKADAKGDPAPTPGYAGLEDAALLEQLGLVDDSVVYLAYWVPGEGSGTGAWEPVQVPEFESLHEEEGGHDAVEPEDRKGKGKA
ncbi:uncharacterized protein EV422DRAFT_535840 [Fimicolochytrium jonesii]|uniref:uncharacterized protein n=1 Tax=Fimicolochytrium jonesii TaxID=1396493 RepID=UPI0022FE82F3|nr:uncharacterized protein EV422DRAFT_535840 [Fimicolochytrium jonesii]KAI8818898.1 hypothetical protein EV422DRAFT_535840 [Fimicolochytrium jonesii]